MKKTLRVMTLLAGVVSALSMTACEKTVATKKYVNGVAASEKARKKSVQNVMTATEAPVLEVSLDRVNIAKRLEQSNDVNHIQWMYLFSDKGAVIERFAVRGKATSGSKRLNRPVEVKKMTSRSGGYSNTSFIKVPAADEMGTYGSSAPYLFWFDLDDTLVQTNLKYITLNKPVNIKGGVLRMSDVDEKELTEKRKIEEFLNQGMDLSGAKLSAGAK